MVLAVLAFTDLRNCDFSSTCLRCCVMRLLYDPLRYCVLQVLRCVSVVLGNSFRFLSWFC